MYLNYIVLTQTWPGPQTSNKHYVYIYIYTHIYMCICCGCNACMMSAHASLSVLRALAHVALRAT